MKTIIKLINLAALLGSVAWLSKDTNWEPLLLFLALLAAFLGQEILPTIKKVNKEDKKLGELFLKEFPSNGKSCLFLKEHELHNPFRQSQLDEIEKFLSEWDNTEHEFLNKKLERIKKELLSKINKFLSSLFTLVRAHDSDVNILTTKLSGAYNKEVEEENDLKIAGLNKMATDIYKKHQILTKKIKRILNS
ncbi:hypothetical protein KKA15_05025 [Patescibacteria group bacterium]|nr:hypothetical protein [Patescibacteria group bacterium]